MTHCHILVDFKTAMQVTLIIFNMTETLKIVNNKNDLVENVISYTALILSAGRDTISICNIFYPFYYFIMPLCTFNGQQISNK